MVHDYARALGGERSADGLTYATSTAGDEHHLTIQPGFHAGREMFRYFMFSEDVLDYLVHVLPATAVGTADLEGVDVGDAQLVRQRFMGVLRDAVPE